MTTLVTPPDISEADLLFDESETRLIFKFFWPSRAEKIEALEMSNHRRMFAQQLLIVGIDSTYALGFIESVMKLYLQPRAGFKGLVVMGRKLAQRYVRHWWKHATQADLENPKIAEAVRAQIAANFRVSIDEFINNASYTPRFTPFYLVNTGSDYWGAA